MVKHNWSDEKALALRNDKTRGGVGFEDIVVAIESGRLLDIVPSSRKNHDGQFMYIVELNGYAYCVPFVETKTGVFLKTIFPSRKYTAKYLLE
jgi:hypothetical protein